MPGFNRIAGETSAQGDRWFRPFDPRTGQPTAYRFPDATAGEITAAIEAALEAAPAMAAFPSSERAGLLRSLAEQLERRGERLAAQADIETGLGRDHLLAELGESCRRLRHLADAVADGQDVGADIRLTDGAQGPSRSRWVGRGPVVIFSATAAPFLNGVAGWDAASALATGSPVISKAHPAHPATAEACAVVIDGTLRARGWPPGGHGLLHGQRIRVAEDLISASGVAAVGFSGPQALGRELFDLANARPDPIPFSAAAGGVNPVVVTPGAAARRRDMAAAHIAGAVTSAGGQGSARPGLVVVPADVSGDWLLDAVAARLRAAGRQPMQSADVHTAFAGAVADRVALRGVTPLVERVIDASPGYAQDPVLLVVGAGDVLESPKLLEEVCGPLLVAVRCTDDEITDVLAPLTPCAVAVLHADGQTDDSEVTGRLIALLTGCAERVIVVDGGHAGENAGGVTEPLDSLDWGWTPPAVPAMRRWQRIVTYQGVPTALLPPSLQDANPENLTRTVDGAPTRRPL